MPGTTFGAVLTEIGQPLEFMTLGLPELQPGQVLVDLAYSGVCRTQLNEIQGNKGPDRFLPHTLGHEGCGIVQAIGSRVAKIDVGDRVVLSWLKGQGAEVPGTTYEGPDFAVNSGAVSTFLTKAVVSENRVTLLPDDVPMREGALFGCALPTGAGMVMHTASLKAGQSLAIFGAGGIGLSALAMAASRGAHPLIVVDVVADKLALAKSMGATHVINAMSEDVPEAIRQITGQGGVDFAIEAAGRLEAMESAFEATRPGGGLCIVAGNAVSGSRVSIDPFQLIEGRIIRGSWGGECKLDEDIPLFAEMLHEKKLNLGEMITHVYALEDLNKAFAELDAGRVGRALIEMPGDT